MSQRLGRYRLVSKLATGGMASVFLAEQTGLGGFSKKVVIKRMRAKVAEDSQMKAMFSSEAVLAAQLTHPNLVQVYDFLELDGEPCIVMEYVDGPNLKRLLQLSKRRKGQLPIEHSLKIASWVCEGLAYAHGLLDPKTGELARLVHRDVTPDNVLLARSGNVKLADFGIVKATTQLHETRPGDIKGKYQYMAPEQLLSRPIDGRADLFALGAVLHQMITGESPFARDNDAAVMDAVVHDEVAPLNELRPDAPAALDSLIRRATAKRPEDRFSSALQMQEALERQLFKLAPLFGPAQLRQLINELDPSPMGAEEETTTDAAALAFDQAALARATADEPMRSIEVSITGPSVAEGPGEKTLDANPKRASVVWPILGAAALSATATYFVVREMIPAVIIAPEAQPASNGPAPDTAAKSPATDRQEGEVPTPPARAVGKATPTPDAASGEDAAPSAAAPSEDTAPTAAAPQPSGRSGATPTTDAVAAAPAQDAAPEPREPSAPEQGAARPLEGRARVTLQSTPEATVYLDGKNVGRTPLAIPVKFGAHRLRFEDTEAGLNKSAQLIVPEEREYHKAFVFAPARLFVMAPDGATIYVGKRRVGKVPMGPISLYEGSHTVRVVYAPTNLDLTKKLELKGGDRFEPFVDE